MRSIKNVITAKNIGCGYLYFYIHFITEIVCFYFLNIVTKGSIVIWFIPLVYDGLAFVPQSLIGYIKDKFQKFNVSIIGCVLLFFGILLYMLLTNIFLSLILICIGNACIHIGGAEVTLRNSKGKLSHSAIFVAGGSFGVILGKILSNYLPIYILLPLILTMIPFIMLANTYNEEYTSHFTYDNQKLSKKFIIILIIFVIVVRGYIGYGIPTSWNKTVFQAIILYFTMGIGKALGGILSDAFGIKKVAIFSTIGAIPFLLIGDNLMLVSLIGVMLFSMTMPITLAVLTSILHKKPGLAFGLTTIGLFLGTVPIFFIKIINQTFNSFLIIILSLICTLILSQTIRKEVKS